MELKLKELLNTNKEQIVLCNSMGNTPSAVYNTLANAKKDSISLIINKLKEEYGNLEVELITQRDAWSDDDYNIDDVYIMVTKDKRSMIVIEGEDKTGYRE